MFLSVFIGLLKIVRQKRQKTLVGKRDQIPSTRQSIPRLKVASGLGPREAKEGKRDQIPSIDPASEGGQWSGSAGPRVRGVFRLLGK